MHILLIHQYFVDKGDSGGLRFNEMTKVWAEMGHRITVISGMVHYATGKKAERFKGHFISKEKYCENVDLIHCHVSEAYNKNFLGRLWAYFSFVISSIICIIFTARNKYDLILATSPPLFVGITCLIISRLYKIPFIFEVRDLWPESAVETGVLRNKLLIRISYKFEKLIYKKSRLINVLTTAFRDKLIREKNIPPEKIIYIPNGSDFSISDRIMCNFNKIEFRKKHGLNGKMIITYVGAHGIANHLMQVIETAELLRDKEILFLLIGDGMEKNMLKEEVRKRNLQNVKFIDSVPKEKIFEYILASDFGASILKKTNTFKTVLSNKTFDYMSCKKPIFMLIDGVSRELIDKADCGIYSEPESPKMFAENIKKILNGNKDIWISKGENGYNYAKLNFNRIELAKKYIKEIERVI